jgi:Glycosyl transferase family 2
MSSEAETLVSVVIIFFNAQEFFEESIASVLAQTHSRIELLLCDDGSTDGSTAIAPRWAESAPQVRYLEHPGHAHRGMNSTRNPSTACASPDEPACRRRNPSFGQDQGAVPGALERLIVWFQRMRNEGTQLRALLRVPDLGKLAQPAQEPLPAGIGSRRVAGAFPQRLARARPCMPPVAPGGSAVHGSSGSTC